MGIGKKTGGRDFQPGNTFSKGRRKLPDDIKEVKKLTRGELDLRINKFLSLTKDELQAVSKDPSTSILDLTIVSILAKGLIHGDQQRFDFVLNRIIGKVKDEVEITMPKPTVIKRSDGTEVVFSAEKPLLEEK